MIKQIIRITKSTLFKGSIIIFVSTAIGNFFNYLYHLVTGRMLTPSEYGLLQGFISLTYYQSILIGAFSISVIEMVGSCPKGKLNAIIKSLEKLGVKLSFIWWLSVLAVYPLVRILLRFDDFGLFFLFSLQALFSFLPAVYGSSLNARLKFIPAGITSILSTLLKLISVIIFLLFGFAIIGGLGSWVIGSFISLIVGAYFVYRFWIKERPKQLPALNLGFLKFSILSLFVNLSLTSLYTTDVLLSRYFLDNHLTGLYAATSNLGKIIFFGATTVMTVAFPMFVKYRDKKENIKSVFWLAFIFCLIIGAGGTILFYLFPEVITRLLYGHQYIEASIYLGKFAVFITLLSVLTLLSQFLLSIRSKFSALVTGLSALIQVVLIIFNHQNISAIINSSLIAVIIGVIIQLVIVLKSINESEYQQVLSYRPGV